MSTDPDYPSPWLRLGAVVADAILFSIPFFVLVAMFDPEQFVSERDTAEMLAEWPLGVLGLGSGFEFFFTWVVYPLMILFFWVNWQATPGKMMARIKIVDARTGEPPSLGQYIVRFIGYLPSKLAWMLPFLLVPIHEKHQGIHDLLAGTVVVRKDAPEVESDEAGPSFPPPPPPGYGS